MCFTFQPRSFCKDKTRYDVGKLEFRKSKGHNARKFSFHGKIDLHVTLSPHPLDM